MLEKIGLPAKPSMRGSNWVIDASHCQGCSNQFTFINRKHHCRRCGGLFCGSCTQQRMVLRGQGDSAVRICEPCKKLEEAARFELRHGNRNKSARGGPKLSDKSEDEVLNQILGTDTKKTSPSGISGFDRGASSGSSFNYNEQSVSPGDKQTDTTDEIGSDSPEKLIQQSLEEKKKYRILKGEGKPDEALRAFKRGKELERQAKALEVTLKKNNRKALSSSNSVACKTNEDCEKVITKTKLSSHIDKEEKKDLASELRELGWSEADLHDAEKKPVKTSLEGELSSLIGQVHKKSGATKAAGSIDKTQVIELKKKALLLKREGKLAEAKEELKKAKILEKELEEQEFLADAEDSDDELSALIRGMDDDKQDPFSLMDGQDTGFDFNHLLGASADLGLDGNFEVTEDDMDDPEMAAALESLGWTADSEHPVPSAAQSGPVDGKSILDEVLALKKEAVKQKRSGNVEEAMTLLRKAKLLEKDAQSSESQDNNSQFVTPTSEKVLTDQTPENSLPWMVDDGMARTSKAKPKSKLMIQRELLGIKKRALTLRREGKVDEAEEELRKGKVLESQLEEMESGSRVNSSQMNATNIVSEPVQIQPDISGNVGLEEVDDDADVTEQDMQDPAMLKLLETLGWKEDRQPENFPSRNSNPVVQSTTVVSVMAPKRSKAELQRELLGLKRKALTLRRQGEIEEAEEVLKKAKLIEEQMEEIEVPKKESPPSSITNTQDALGSLPTPLLDLDPPLEIKANQYASPIPQSDNLVDLLTGENWQNPQVQVEVESKAGIGADNLSSNDSYSLPGVLKSSKNEEKVSVNETDAPNDVRQEILTHKRKAVALKREGKIAEAREELKQAKLLERTLQEDEPQPKVSSTEPSLASTSHDTSVMQEEHKTQAAPKPMTGRDRFKLQQQSLSHKRQALKLRREGRTAEADAEFELAKALETQLEEASGQDSKKSNETEGMDDLGIENLLDPQLLSALKAIGIQDLEAVPEPPPNRPEATTSNPSMGDTSSKERSQLEEQIKGEKIKAVTLKRAGKQAEALDALRCAKMYEKKLNTLAG
ncbi:hypothetical protein ACHQM5_003805 [Ranunculus cassubicifolius]